MRKCFSPITCCRCNQHVLFGLCEAGWMSVGPWLPRWDGPLVLNCTGCTATSPANCNAVCPQIFTNSVVSNVAIVLRFLSSWGFLLAWSWLKNRTLCYVGFSLPCPMIGCQDWFHNALMYKWLCFYAELRTSTGQPERCFPPESRICWVSLPFAGSMLPCGQDVTQNGQPVDFGI